MASDFSLSTAAFKESLGLAVGEALGTRPSEIPWFAFLMVLGASD